MYNRETINELNALSKEVFGSTSKWRKMIEKGVSQMVTEDTKRLNHDGTSETVKTPKMHVGKSGGEMYQHSLTHFTVESVRDFMVNVLIQRQKNAEALKKEQEQKKTDAINAASGSSI